MRLVKTFKHYLEVYKLLGRMDLVVFKIPLHFPPWLVTWRGASPAECIPIGWAWNKHQVRLAAGERKDVRKIYFFELKQRKMITHRPLKLIALK